MIDVIASIKSGSDMGSKIFNSGIRLKMCFMNNASYTLKIKAEMNIISDISEKRATLNLFFILLKDSRHV